MTDVAVIGTGRMGAAMVGRLTAAGHAVTVFNRTAARAQDVAMSTGASAAPSAGEAAAAADVVICSLADDAAVRATYAALLPGLRPGATVLECSTIAPATVRELAPLVTEQGATLLDTPVSGSVASVERGELTVLAGGPLEAVDLVRNVLAAFAARVLHLGELGSGATMKLAVNAVIFGLNQSLAEALVLAEKAGVARELAYEVFASSAVAAPFVQYKRESFLRPQGTPVAFALDLVAKDLSLIEAHANEVGARMEQVDTDSRIVAQAIAAGYGARDLSAIADLLRRD
jgi:3-hydroxyisobutyrate dehydrogenase/2-hydroxy-3-oxopropionate reductase